MSNDINITDKLISVIQEASQATQVDIREKHYVSKPVFLPPAERVGQPIEVHSLSAVAGYVNHQSDTFQNLFVVIESATAVTVCTPLNDDRQREILLNGNAIPCSFRFNAYYNVEDFIIALQSQFAATDDGDKILQLVGNLAAGAVFTLQDDGVTQQTQAKTGIERLANVEIPRIVTLAPYRSFRDLDRQPMGKFVLRLKRDGEGDKVKILAALFEADGGQWQNEAIGLCKSYLEDTEKGGIQEGKAVIIG